MEKYKKEVGITYFSKLQEINIDKIEDNSIVYLKIDSPLNYGIREWDYYGKILHKTRNYFDFLEYCTGSLNYWYSSEILKKENSYNIHIKRWSKNRIKELYLVSTNTRKEIIELYKNN